MMRELQLAVVERLKSDSYFEAVPVVAATKGDLAATIETELGKIGTVVVVEIVAAPVSFSGGNITLAPDLKIFVFENVLLNRSASGSGKIAEATAERVVWLLRPGQDPAAPVHPTRIALENDLTEELTYRIDCTQRKNLEIEA